MKHVPLKEAAKMLMISVWDVRQELDQGATYGFKGEIRPGVFAYHISPEKLALEVEKRKTCSC